MVIRKFGAIGKLQGCKFAHMQLHISSCRIAVVLPSMQLDLCFFYIHAERKS